MKSVNLLSTYLLVGVALAVVSYSLYLIITEFFLIQPYQAVLLAYPLNLLLAYYCSVKLTFRHIIQSKGSFFKYCILSLFLVAVNEIFLMILIDGLALRHSVAQAMITILLPIISFAMQHVWVFRPKLR